MANYNSALAAYGDVKSPIDVDFMGKVLMAKQGSFDAGLAQIDESLAAMKQQENILIRPEDKARLAGNIQTLLNTVNSSGKLDLSSKNITRTIKNQIGTALDDYTVTQIGNSQKIRTAYAEASEKQKKGDATYNATNFNFMLAQAGVEDYIKGYNSKGEKVDNVGELVYDNYIDSIKLLKDDIDKWGKDYGIHAEWTKEGKAGDLIYTDIKHNVLRKEDVLERMKTSLNPKIMKQFTIDAWAHYKGTNEEELHKDVTQFYTSENAKEDINIANAEARKVGATKAEIIKIDAAIANYTSNKQANLEKINNKKYNPEQEKTIIYTNSLLNGLAESYQKDEEVERVTNDSNLDIAKFNVDVEYKKASLDQGQQRIDLAKKANDIADTANVIASGAGVKVDTQDATDTRTATEVATQTNADSYKNLVTLLAKESKKYNASTTDAQRSAFIAGITKEGNVSNVNTENYSAELIEAIDDFKAKSTIMQKGRQAIVNEITPSLINSYNAMVGSKKIDFNNLAITAPLTASYLKKGMTLEQIQKQVDSKGNPIGKQTVAMIKHEMAVNSLNFMDVGNEDQKHSLELYVKNLENQSFLTADQKISMRSKDKQSFGVMEGVGDMVGALLGIGGALFKNGASRLIARAQGDADAFKKADEDFDKSFTNTSKQWRSGFLRGEANSLDRWGLQSDTNLSEIQYRDLNNTDKVKGVSGAITTAIISATNKKNEEYIKLKPNTYNTEAVSFNPQDSKGKKVIESVILPQLSAVNGGQPLILAKGTMVTASMPAGSSDIQVTYTPEKGEQTTTTIKGEYMPSLQSTLYMKSPNHINSRLNENAPQRIITYETPTDTKDKFELLKKINRNFGENIISSALVADMGKIDSPLETQVSLRAYGKNTSPEVQQEINRIAESAYQVVWEQQGDRFEGTLKDANGKAVLIDGREVIVPLQKNGVPSNYSAGEARLQTIQLINDAKKIQIKTLIGE